MIPAPPLPPVGHRRAPAMRVMPEPPLPLLPAPPLSSEEQQAHDPALGRAVEVLRAFSDAHADHIGALADLHRKFLAQQSSAASHMLAVRAARAPAMYETGGSTETGGAIRGLPVRPGPKLGRSDLEDVANRKRSIASVFGPLFARQDNHRYQIRIPAPPMTIMDRLLGIEGEPGSLGSGKLWSETDVTPDCWWLDPAGRVTVMAIGESAQGNMLLASWLGADLTHAGDRRYRLLNVVFEAHASMPKVGDTMCVEVALERQTEMAGLRLFFFTAEVSVRSELSFRAHFTAGLFSEDDLSRPERINWSAARDTRTLEGPFEPPAGYEGSRSFSREQLDAFRDGRIYECFGPGFERAVTHARPPRAAAKFLSRLSGVPAFEPAGGPWGRGYLRAEQTLSPDAWFFAAHFPGDPCMPGFLMAEGAVQALSFHLTALGATLHRDGWRFEPVLHRQCTYVFRGQVVPQTATLSYEVFVESLVTGPQPRIVADVICSLGERPVFHARRLALCLVPDTPDLFRQAR